MAYGESQYGNFQFQFGNLSPIIEAALQRREKQKEQQEQMNAALGSLVGKAAYKTPGQVAIGSVTDDSGAPVPLPTTGGDTGTSAGTPDMGGGDVKEAQYGPGVGETYHDAVVGAYDNQLQ